jgi:probable rRNA maturation factor
MVLFIQNDLHKKIIPGSWLKKISSQTLIKIHGERFEKKVELSLRLTDMKTIQHLNQQYLKHNWPTDVLAFPLGEIYDLQHPIYLGDVVLCPQKISEQAQENQKTFRQEFALLLIHGILHLLGYDHNTVRQKKQMFLLQDQILEKLKLK